MNQEVSTKVDVMKNVESLETQTNAGWTVVGPRNDEKKDFAGLARFFKRNIEVFPEQVLLDDGFEIVPPSSFTNDHQLMFKDEGTLVRYTMTQYKLNKGAEEIPLYVLLDEEKATF